jgi:SepF-like predicted cell division protein (DUF552 family)
MKGFFMRLKGMMKQPAPSEPVHMPEEDEGYVELSTDSNDVAHSKITVRPFILEDFNGVKGVLDAIREGYTVALINIKPLKDSDIVELKRAINKLKKTCDAIDGDIAGFGEDWICVTPSFAHIHRETKPRAVAQPRQDDMDDFGTF